MIRCVNESNHYIFFVFILLLSTSHAQEKQKQAFRHFTVELPEGWQGEEQSGFVDNDPDTWLLTLAKKAGDSFIAQVSIYLLPNKPGVSSAEAAARLAEAQSNPTTPVADGNFMMFKGEPRTQAVKGRATTRVCATPAHLLIIIAQDPQKLGSEQIIESLKGETDEAKAMFGR